MNKLKITLLSAILLFCVAPQFANANATSNTVTKATMINGVYAGYFRYYFPEDPDLYIDFYVYVEFGNPSKVVGYRQNSINGTYYGAIGTSDGTYANFTTTRFPGTQFSGQLQ